MKHLKSYWAIVPILCVAITVSDRQHGAGGDFDRVAQRDRVGRQHVQRRRLKPQLRYGKWRCDCNGLGGSHAG
jgi:hypothetical protein